MLNRQQLNQLRVRLEALHDEVAATLSASADAGQTVELDQTRQGRLSRMDALQGQAMAQAAHARAAARMHSIKISLNRLAADDFGDCVECGEQIPFKRLAIDPTTRYCIRCASEREA